LKAMCEYCWGDVPGSPNFTEVEEESEVEEMQEIAEVQQKDWAALALKQAEGFTIKTQQDYDNAAELCKDIKAAISAFEKEWAPLKSKAYEAWKGLCAKENEMLGKYRKAESDLKKEMTAFQRQKLEEERLLREEQERWKKEQAEKLLQDAAKAEEEGKMEHSDYLFEMAEQTQRMQFEQPKPVKTAGTATKRIWKARVINASLVPISVAGAVIRPVDEKVLNDLARASKGNMTIPGVEFYEDVQIAVGRG
jgi:hypothetical protein